MPNIRGLGPLIAMIFAPCVEVNRNKTQTRYVSILSGLGFNAKQNRAVYEEHDMIFDLDVKIDIEDFEVVRKSEIILLKNLSLRFN